MAISTPGRASVGRGEEKGNGKTPEKYGWLVILSSNSRCCELGIRWQANSDQVQYIQYNNQRESDLRCLSILCDSVKLETVALRNAIFFGVRSIYIVRHINHPWDTYRSRHFGTMVQEY